MSDRCWDSTAGRWVYDGAECTCDMAAWPCDVHETDVPYRWDREAQRWVERSQTAAIAGAFRAAAKEPRWRNPEHRHVRDWLMEHADRIEKEG